MFDRFELLVGNDNLKTISNISVLIVGIGGVGTYTLESLVRIGVQNIIIIDNDVIEQSNINRQLIALSTNIGCKKTDEAAIRAKKINPNINIIKHNIFLNEDNFKILYQYHLDYIVDACDTISTKLLLIKYAQENNIKIICAMGLGNRLDARKVLLTTLDKTYNDPLAKVVRRELKKANYLLKILVVCSVELPIKGNKKQIASCSYVPAIAGLLITSYITNDLISLDS